MEGDCDLCTQALVKLGKDKLLFEDSFCYIVDNGNTELFVDGVAMRYSRRVSLTLKRHGANPGVEVRALAVVLLRRFVATDLCVASSLFFIRETMNTYPDHFHIHAYVGAGVVVEYHHCCL